MGNTAQRFAEDDIDFDVLSDLSDQDLEKIGVTSLGHCRKLLRAIADLKGVEQIKNITVTCRRSAVSCHSVW